MPSIKSVHARQILDSRATPTVEVEVSLSDGAFGRAAVPSGASTGSREAFELRDGSSAFLGKGVQKAIQNIHEVIFPEITQHEWDQQAVDQKMIEMDGTEMKSKLGANAILGVSMAFCVATAASQKRALYEYIGLLSGNSAPKLPVPIFNVLNGGAHANWSTDIQEYILFPVKTESFQDQLRKGAEVFQHLGKLLASKGMSTNVGNEGGYAPQLSSNEEAFDLMLQAIEDAGYQPGKHGDFMLGIDAAATEFFQDGVYQLKKDQQKKSSDEMIEWMDHLAQKYPIFSLEDALAEEDWDGWAKLTERIGSTVQIVGDDLTVTNPKYITKAVHGKNCTAVIIKLNQIGTVTQTLEAMRLVHEAGWKNIVSHRSGETEDIFITHLCVGAGGHQIKTGAPSRTDRTAKYNELLRIAERLTTN